MKSDIILNAGKSLYTHFRPLFESPKAAMIIFLAAEAINQLGNRLQNQKFVKYPLQHLSPRVKQVATTTMQFAFNALGTVAINRALGCALSHPLVLTIAALPVMLRYVIDLMTPDHSIHPIKELSEVVYQKRVKFQEALMQFEEEIVGKVQVFADRYKSIYEPYLYCPNPLSREISIGFVKAFLEGTRLYLKEMKENSTKFDNEQELTRGLEEATALLADFEQTAMMLPEIKESKGFIDVKREELFSLTAKSLQRDWPTHFSSAGEEQDTYEQHSDYNTAFVREQRGKKPKNLINLLTTADEKNYLSEKESWEQDIDQTINPVKKVKKQKAFYILQASLNLIMMKRLRFSFLARYLSHGRQKQFDLQ